MAEPKLQIEKRVENVELAIRIMAQEFLDSGAASRIELILQGKKEPQEDASSQS
jgi:hypothetical protein